MLQRCNYLIINFVTCNIAVTFCYILLHFVTTCYNICYKCNILIYKILTPICNNVTFVTRFLYSEKTQKKVLIYASTITLYIELTKCKFTLYKICYKFD